MGYGGSSPSGGTMGGGLASPPKKKKKCKPFVEKKPEYASLNIFKTMSSSQPLLNLSKYKSEDPRDIFRRSSFFGITNCAFLVLQIAYLLCSKMAKIHF